MEMVLFDDFKKIDIRVGRIIDVQDHPDAARLYVLNVDIGEEQKKIVAGIRAYYQKDQLLGKFVIIVANLQPRKIRGVESQGMLLAGFDDTNLAVVTIDKPLKPGTPIT
ncbi:MAG TPA: methionine--tRNA ligase subunit beta [bacterium]|nr:methionine--tRNA ligase subunit beta [bacterium]